jgi:hypothetical protein
MSCVCVWMRREQALMHYHNLKIKEVNTIIRELWLNTYKGQDIESIEIRCEEVGYSSLWWGGGCVVVSAGWDGVEMVVVVVVRQVCVCVWGVGGRGGGGVTQSCPANLL